MMEVANANAEVVSAFASSTPSMVAFRTEEDLEGITDADGPFELQSVAVITCSESKNIYGFLLRFR